MLIVDMQMPIYKVTRQQPVTNPATTFGLCVFYVVGKLGYHGNLRSEHM